MRIPGLYNIKVVETLLPDIRSIDQFMYPLPTDHIIPV